ncbi:MAG: hypothetical protein ACJAVV_003185 [Alphaproteobacteria bacterium]|jgi:hypothetical protein
MNINQKLAALLLISAGTLSTQVTAHESGVERIVANLVSNAMNNVSVEIDQQVQKITLTASNLVSIDGSNQSVGEVTITDLASLDSKEIKASQEDFQKVSADD